MSPVVEKRLRWAALALALLKLWFVAAQPVTAVAGAWLDDRLFVWLAEQMKAWDAARHFAPDSDGLFAVVQSNTYISPQQVARKLAPYFPIEIQPYERHVDRVLKAAELYSAVTRRGLKLLRRLRGL